MLKKHQLADNRLNIIMGRFLIAGASLNYLCLVSLSRQHAKAVDAQMNAATIKARHDIGLSLEEFNAIHDDTPDSIEYNVDYQD